MTDLTFGEILKCQYELWEKHKDTWSPMEPKYARNSLMWLMGELGEAVQIIKKCGETQIAGDAALKAAFTEELCDVVMYLGDTMLRMGISAEDMAGAYRKKHAKNMRRSFEKEAEAFAQSLT